MANTMFEATYLAAQQITSTFDIVWALDAGLWNFRESVIQYLHDHPEANPKEVTDALVKGLHIHGLNPKRIATELTWEYEEQYIAELLLINAIAIFDSWVDSFVDSALLRPSNNQKKKIKKATKEGNPSALNNALNQEDVSLFAGSFQFTANRQDAYIDNLWLVYKYFKVCRNCCAHGNHRFNDAAETNYSAIKGLSKEDCGIKEFPKIAFTKSGEPLKLILRGVVGFYDVLIRIINHYDLVAADKISVEHELLRRLSNIPSIKLSSKEQKRNRSIRQYAISVNMCPPRSSKTNDIYKFLVAKRSRGKPRHQSQTRNI